jgi:hypothetical protein
VIHQYEFARRFEERGLRSRLFIQAKREAAGLWTFKLKEGKPLRTSFGEDLCRQIFLQSRHHGAVAAASEGLQPLALAGGPGRVTGRS